MCVGASWRKIRLPKSMSHEFKKCAERMTQWGTGFRLLSLPSHLLVAEAKALGTSVSDAMDFP